MYIKYSSWHSAGLALSACQDTGEEVVLFEEIDVGRWEQAWFQNVEVTGRLHRDSEPSS